MDDPLQNEAIRVICQYDRASVSLLQRKLSIGYNRAKKLLDALAEAKILSKPDGAKPVDILIRNAEDALKRLEQKDLYPEYVDPLLESAARLVIGLQKCSATLLQDKLDAGYARSARMVDQLEELGVIGHGNGKDPRKVNYQNYEELEKALILKASVRREAKTYIQQCAAIIEKTFESFHITTRVAEVNDKQGYVQYCLEIALGTPISEIVKHEKDLALALASITGQVEIQAPIPGRSLIGVNVPKYPKIIKSLSGWRMVGGWSLLKVSDWLKDTGYRVLLPS